MINGHKSAMLQFSGGKDSLACLWLLEEFWPDLLVAWVNTGDAFPETLSRMEAVKALVPNFLEIKSNQPMQIARAGYPVDLVPVWDTEFGRALDTSRENRYQPAYGCCGENIWEPMREAVKKHGVTLIIRGQRNEETKKAPVRSGDFDNGVQLWFPIENWTEAQVREFLDERIPPHYQFLDTSLDCQHCTAYLSENRNKLAYMKKVCAGVAVEVERRLRKIHADCTAELNDVRAALGEV